MPPAAKYALTYLFVQAEFGLCCPLSMTDSLTRTLRRYGDPALVQRFLPRLTTQDFDALHQGAMFMTEQGAGSDVAATATRAVPEPGGASYRLYGDKWFCSNPDAELAMVLARIDGAPAGLAGVSLFLLPRTLDDGTANARHIVRLKDKLGTRSMASGEIRLDGARAHLVGQAGRGFQQMADMVNNSRLSNGMRAAGLMRRATSEALFIARTRVAFGRRLVELPLMRRQLLKLLLPSEQARCMVFQTADALRRADAGDSGAAALVRILTPLIKFRACRDARKVTADAMEVRGGCGYIEEWGDPQRVRDAHLGSIWEGTSNIVALDVHTRHPPRRRPARAAGPPARPAGRHAAACRRTRGVRAGAGAGGRRRRTGGRGARRRRCGGAPGGVGAVPRDDRHRDGLGGRRHGVGAAHAAGAGGAAPACAAAGPAGVRRPRSRLAARRAGPVGQRGRRQRRRRRDAVQRPLNCGLRLSMKACRPSWKSSLP